MTTPYFFCSIFNNRVRPDLAELITSPRNSSLVDLCVADLDEDSDIDFDDLHLLIDLVFEETCCSCPTPSESPDHLTNKQPVSPTRSPRP